MTMSISKQKALDKLDHELSARITRLRDTCAYMSRSLLARTELQLANMPRCVREMSMKDLISSGQSPPEIDAAPEIVSVKTAQVNRKRGSNSPTRTIKRGRIVKSNIETKKPPAKRVKRG